MAMDGEEGEWTSSKVRAVKKVSECQRRRKKVKLGWGCEEGESTPTKKKAELSTALRPENISLIVNFYVTHISFKMFIKVLFRA